MRLSYEAFSRTIAILRQQIQSVLQSRLFIPFCLIFLTVGTYREVTTCDFILLDDIYYVVGNPHLHHGFTWKSLEWAFTAGILFRTPYVDYWQPITVLSRIVDVTWFGMDPAMHHLTNLLFHILNTLLVYAFFLRITKLKRPSFFIAALFAIHPLHVESVAWVAERKDVLSCFFWFLSLRAYFEFVIHQTRVRYLTVLALFALGLMCKPMVVTFPAVLLVMDFMILKRAKSLRILFLEKLPFFILSLASIFLTLKSQPDHVHSSIPTLLGAASSSYINYLFRTLVPVRLSVWYFYQEVAPWKAFLAVLFLGIFTFFAVRHRLRYPFILTGWAWFLITLTPVVALKDIAGADRFTYIPIIGLFWIAACGLETWVQSHLIRTKFLSCLEVLLVTFLSIGTTIQVSYWKNNIALFEHALEISNNHIVQYCLGLAYFGEKQVSAAEFHLRETIRIEPGYVKAYAYLGLLCGTVNRTEEAKAFFKQALVIDSNCVEAHYNLGTLQLGQNQLQDAEKHLKESITLQPDFVDGYYNLGNLLLKQNRLQEAAEQFATALEINPEFSKAHNNLGICLVRQQQFDEGMDHYQAAIQLAPQWAEPYVNMGLAYLRQNNPIKARPCLEKAIQLDPNLKKPRELLDQIDATHK